MKLNFKVAFPKEKKTPSFIKGGPFQRRLKETGPMYLLTDCYLCMGSTPTSGKSQRQGHPGCLMVCKTLILLCGILGIDLNPSNILENYSNTMNAVP